jgi:hypothetical protein
MNLIFLHIVLFGSAALALPLALPLTSEQIAAQRHLLAAQELAKQHQVHSHNANVEISHALAKNQHAAAGSEMIDNANHGMKILEQMDHHENEAAKVYPWMNPPKQTFGASAVAR